MNKIGVREKGTDQNDPRLATTRVAVLGYGYWGPNQVRTFARQLGSDHVIVADPLPARLEAAADAFPGIELRSDVESILTDPTVQALCICTPAATHAGLAAQALNLGKHVLVEKPLATSSRDAAELVRLAEQVERVLMVGHVFLYSAPVRRLQALARSNELGSLRFMHGTRTSLGPRAREDTNIVWDYLIHDVYISHSLLGEPEEIAAHGQAYLRPGIEDVVFATLRYADGILVNLHASWYDPHKIRKLTLVGSERMAVYDESWGDRKVVVYDRGYAPARGRDAWGNLDLRLYDDGERGLDTSGPEPLREQCLDFLDAIATGGQPIANGASALGVIRMLEAIDVSLRRGGRPVRLAATSRLTPQSITRAGTK
jgi:predicted dehydrogenase